MRNIYYKSARSLFPHTKPFDCARIRSFVYSHRITNSIDTKRTSDMFYIHSYINISNVRNPYTALSFTIELQPIQPTTNNGQLKATIILYIGAFTFHPLIYDNFHLTLCVVWLRCGNTYTQSCPSTERQNERCIRILVVAAVLVFQWIEANKNRVMLLVFVGLIVVVISCVHILCLFVIK